MKKLKTALLTTVIFLSACSNPKDTTVKEKQTFTINMVSHGQASDPFWSTVKNGAEAAAKKLGVNLIYQAPTNFDMVTMAQMIDAVTATAPHGLIVSVPDIAALKKSIGNAIDKNIPVIAINSGQDIGKELDILTYIGQSEFEAGMKAAEGLLKYNINKAVCINHEVGNISLDHREAGFKYILNQNGIDVTTIPIDAADPSETKELVRSYLKTNPGTNAILTLGPLGALPILKLMKEINQDGRIKMATFDFTPEIINGILKEEVVFALDQQQYLQGYLPVVFLYLYLTNQNTPAFSELQTGPSFITKENAQQILELSKRGTR